MHRKNRKWEETKHRQDTEAVSLTAMKDGGQQDAFRSQYHTSQAKIKGATQQKEPSSHQGGTAAHLRGEHNQGVLNTLEMPEEHLEKP